MWMWYKNRACDVFVAKIDAFDSRLCDSKVIFWFDGEWRENVLENFKPPHNH